jgi:hypothetical protein
MAREPSETFKGHLDKNIGDAEGAPVADDCAEPGRSTGLENWTLEVRNVYSSSKYVE